jgi:hypothetical protein
MSTEIIRCKVVKCPENKKGYCTVPINDKRTCQDIINQEKKKTP